TRNLPAEIRRAHGDQSLRRRQRSARHRRDSSGAGRDLKLALGALAACSALGAATLDRWVREGNTVYLDLSEGTAKVEWITDSAFRFTRVWDRTVPRTAPLSSRLVDLRISETAAALRIEARYITLTLDKRGVLAHVADAGGAPVMDDASEP